MILSLLAASVVASIAGKPEGVKYRHQWFQSGDWVEVRGAQAASLAGGALGDGANTAH